MPDLTPHPAAPTTGAGSSASVRFVEHRATLWARAYVDTYGPDAARHLRVAAAAHDERADDPTSPHPEHARLAAAIYARAAELVPALLPDNPPTFGARD